MISTIEGKILVLWIKASTLRVTLQVIDDVDRKVFFDVFLSVDEKKEELIWRMEVTLGSEHNRLLKGLDFELIDKGIAVYCNQIWECDVLKLSSFR